MKSILIYCLLGVALACGGSGGGSGSGSSAPTITQYTIFPATTSQNDGGGSITINDYLEFVDPDGDVTTLRFSAGGQSQDYAISGASGITEGYMQGSFLQDTSQVGSYSYQVELIDGKNQISNAVAATFLVTSPAPIVSSINPISVIAGSQGLTLNVYGSGFFSDSVVLWNGFPRTTTYISSTQLQASISATDVVSQANILVRVKNSTIDGGESTTCRYFDVSTVTTYITNVPANDILWDSTRGVIYASLPSTIGANGNSIAVIDPLTGAITSTAFVGSEPSKLAISDDYQHLYVGLDGTGSIKRLALPSLTSELTISLGHGTFGTYYAQDLQVAPQAPHTIAVSLKEHGLSGSASVLIFDDGTQRPNTIPDFGCNMTSIQWGADASILYGANGDDTGYNYYIINVDASGLALAHDYPGAFSDFINDIHFEANTSTIYSDAGTVITAETGATLGLFAAKGRMIPDPSQQLAFFCSENMFDNKYDLQSFNLSRFTPVGAVKVRPGISLYSLVSRPKRILRWGHNGLVFGGGGIPTYIVTGQFVRGQ
jgi:trimeric autotransporter adhesin